jgi:hypothetical protein
MMITFVVMVVLIYGHVIDTLVLQPPVMDLMQLALIVLLPNHLPLNMSRLFLFLMMNVSHQLGHMQMQLGKGISLIP